MSKNQEDVGKCDGCGKFKRYADMGHMDPEGQIVMCLPCASKYRPDPAPAPVTDR